MSRNLFRQEALDAQRTDVYGAALLVRPISLAVLTIAAVLLAAAIVSFSFWGEYTRKARVSGYLAPSSGLIKVYAPQPGTISEKHVSEGQKVRKGDALFVISMDRGTREAPQAQAAAMDKLREKQHSLEDEHAKQTLIDRITLQALEGRTRTLRAELAQIDREIETQRRRMQSAQSMAQRHTELARAGFLSQVQAQQKEEELLDQQGRLQNLGRARLALQRDLETAQSEQAAAGLKASNHRAGIERGIAGVEQELTEYESRRTVVIPAPADGVITNIMAEPGQAATILSPLASVLPEGAQLRAQLLVPSRAIGFIALGQTVALRYQAFPYQRFGSYRGRIQEVTRTLLSPAEANLPVPLSEPVYRVVVKIDAQSVRAYGHELPLQAGMLLDADIWLDRRRLVQWALDPIYSVTGQL